MIQKEAQEIIISELQKAEEFYVPVKKIWKELISCGYNAGNYNELLTFFKEDKRFEIMEPKSQQFEDGDKNEKEMGELGYYSGPRVKLKSRKITKEDMQRITLKHAQNVIDNLIKAYQVKPEDLPPNKEDELIELMKKSKELKEEIKKAFNKKRLKDN